MRSVQSGRWLWWVAPSACAGALAWWLFGDAPADANAATATATVSPPRAVVAAASAGSAVGGTGPFSGAGLQQRQAQRVLWQQRLERAQEALEAYRRSTRYPFDSQSMADHADQAQPRQPIEESHALRLAGGKGDGLALRTTQERVFVQGDETVRFTVSLRDAEGRAQPLRVLRAWAHEVPAPRTAALHADVALDLNDDARAGDAAAGDGVYGMQLQPATQGFGDLFGQIRVEVQLEIRGEKGFTYFDVFYTPEAPAAWQGPVREAMEDGSLVFALKAQVKVPGRYVVAARVDDANGVPFALLGFNDEMAAGPQVFRLRLFGKLVRDAKPAFPLRLRDVDGFLLRESFPDRMLMARRDGVVHTTGTYAPEAFSDAEWSSEERERYVAELTRDVAQAQQALDKLKP
jgi:hypothetical protein